MEDKIDGREELTSRFQRYAYLGKTFEKAVDAVLGEYVKEHIFVPSGRTIYTVVGSGGDEFIDPQRPYCSCSNFFFRVLSGKREYCYHILGYKMALEAGKIEKITFDDEEYLDFFRIVALDLLDNLKEKKTRMKKDD